MVNPTELDILNYTATLIGWANAETLQSGVSFGGGEKLYEAARAAYTKLTSAPYNWIITPIPIFTATPPLVVQYNEPTTQVYNINYLITPYSPVFLPTNAALAFTVAPALPAGLALDPLTGTLRGTPTVLTPPTPYTITAAMNNNPTIRTTQVITLAIVRGVSYFPLVNTFLEGTPITPLVPTVASGLAIISYATSPALPAGLICDPLTGFISGTPTTPLSASYYTITAKTMTTTYANTLTLTVVAPSVFDILNYSVTLIGWANAETLQSGVSFGGGSILYEAARAAYTKLTTAPYNWIITPIPNFTATPALAVQYNEPMTQTYIIYAPILPYTPAWLSLYSDVRFTVAPALPAGLALDPLTGTLSGTPTVLKSTAFYTITASANNNAIQRNNTITLAVANPAYYLPATYTFFTGTPITRIEPTVVRNINIASYAISPALPSTLYLNPFLGTITGTPTSPLTTTTYTITVMYYNRPYTTPLTLTINTKPMILQFTNVPVNFKVVLPLIGLSSDSTVQVNWGNGTPLTTNILTYNYTNQTVVNYTVKVYIVSGTVSGFGMGSASNNITSQSTEITQTTLTTSILNWQGSANLTAIADWENLPGLKSLNNIGGVVLTTVPTTLPSTVTDLSFIFSGAIIFNQPIETWDVSQVTSMFGMFQEAKSFNQPLDNWQVNKVTNMFYMFFKATAFNQPLNKWNVMSVKIMRNMFEEASSFNQPLIDWNVGQVTDMSRMFFKATAFNQPLDKWNVGQATDMSYMFFQANSFNEAIGEWNVSKVITMQNMFDGASEFNQPIGNWNVGQVSNMFFMFYNASKFNQDISLWNVSKVTNMSDMFRNAFLFNQDISLWNVSKVTVMTNMFRAARMFNQMLGNWNVGQVTTMDNMFNGATNFDALNYSTTLIQWNSLSILQKNVPLYGGLNLYKYARFAYNSLITTPYSWIIIPVPNFLDNPALIVQYNQPTTRIYRFKQPIHPYSPVYYSIYSDIVFSIAPALPSGLTIDRATGRISGTPTEATPVITYTVTTTANAGQLSVKNTVYLAVASDFEFYYYPTVYAFLKDVQIIPIQPTVAAGITISSYAITPTLSSGLIFNTVSGAIRGTPIDASLNQVYTITATKTDSTILTYSIVLNVADISYANVPYIYAQNAEFLYSPFNGYPIIPTRYDSALFESIILTTPLPVELAIDLSDGIIYGIPYTATPTKNYILNATTISGYTKDISLNITVNGFSYTEDGSEPVYTLKINDTVKITVLINVGDYTDFISYPKLPAGLTLDSATGSIFGTVRDQRSSTEVYFISGLVDPIITIPITIIIEANNNYPPICEYKCPPRVIIPPSRDTINTNAMRYSTLVRTGLGQTRFIANSGTNINDAYTQPIRNKF
jgi:surface protein